MGRMVCAYKSDIRTYLRVITNTDLSDCLHIAARHVSRRCFNTSENIAPSDNRARGVHRPIWALVDATNLLPEPHGKGDRRLCRACLFYEAERRQEQQQTLKKA